MTTKATLYVCTTCRAGQEALEDEKRPGEILYERLTAGETPEGVEIKGVKCLSACSSGSAVALAQPGKWTYVYGRLNADEHAADILEGAAAYAATEDGIIPWRERSTTFKKHTLSRIPAFGADDE